MDGKFTVKLNFSTTYNVSIHVQNIVALRLLVFSAGIQLPPTS